MKRWATWAAGAVLLALGFVRQRNEHRIEAFKARLRQRRRWMLLGVAVFLLSAGLVGAFVAVSGIASIKASSGHWAITAWFLEFSMMRSLDTHSAGLTAPFPLDDERVVLLGAGHYETGCRFCHGAPGERMPKVTNHMTPRPPRLSDTVGEFDDAELFYVVHHGVKFTGMPAWPSRERKDEAWAMVAFLRRLPELDRQGYRRLVFGEEPTASDAPRIVTRTCARCHGVDGLGRGVGAFPKLAGQRPEYLRRTLDAYQRGARHSGIMEPISVPLDDRDIDEVVRWYAAQPRPVRGPPPSGTRGEEIAARGIPERRIPACSQCHGPGEEAKYPAYPRLEGQYVDYLEQQLWLFQLGLRGGTEYAEIMQTVASHKLDPEDIRAVAEYYASLGR